MGDREIRLRAVNAPWYDGVEFLLIEKRGNGGRAEALPIVMQEINPESMGYELKPTFKLTRDAAQSLMDELWNCGLRPTEGFGSTGQSAAQQDHIKDLREVTNRLLGVVEHGQS